MSAVSQLVQRAEIFHREPSPPFPVTTRPQIAGQATGKALASNIDLDKFLPAVVAAIHPINLAGEYQNGASASACTLFTSAMELVGSTARASAPAGALFQGSESSTDRVPN